VTTGDSFRSINLDRNQLLQPKKLSPPTAQPGGPDMGFPPLKP
jgi:hypothetical protein